MPLRAALFDFGGTLLDLESDRRARLASFEALAAKFKLEMKGQELADAFEMITAPAWSRADGAYRSLKELLRRAFLEVLPSLGIGVAEKEWGWFWGAYLSVHRQYLTPRPFAASALLEARDLGLHVGLVSDVDDDFLEVALATTNLGALLDAVTTSQQVRRTKPAREMFLAALAKAGCSPAEAVFVGDSLERDIAGAKAVGLRAIHYAAEPCRAADHCVASHQEVAALLRELRGTA
jgi:HAD superfamily hydrolase (TIGR01509 family)